MKKFFDDVIFQIQQLVQSHITALEDNGHILQVNRLFLPFLLVSKLRFVGDDICWGASSFTICTAEDGGMGRKSEHEANNTAR